MADRSIGKQMADAAFQGYLTEIEELLEQGADIDARLYECDSPLIVAVRQAHVHIIEYLLQHGADVGYGGTAGWAPLHEALNLACNYYEEMRIVDLLLEAGADVNQLDSLGRTPLDIAFDIWPEAAEKLKKLGAVRGRPWSGGPVE